MIQNAEAVWLFLMKITETAPLGVWTFLVAAIFPACFGPYLRRGLPAGWHPGSRDFIVETVALLAGIGLAYLPWPTLNGLLVGILGGFMSPYLTRGWQTFWRLAGGYAHKRLLGTPVPLEQQMRTQAKLRDLPSSAFDSDYPDNPFPDYPPKDKP